MIQVYGLAKFKVQAGFFFLLGTIVLESLGLK